MVTRMMGYEEKACHCGEESERLSHLSYGEPPVASSLGPSFPSEGSPQPVPIPLLAADVADLEFPVSPSSPGDSDKENSNEGSFESTQQVMTDLVVIQEEEVMDEDAQALPDAMDAEVRSRLFQRCKSKQGPKHFQPYPKGWKADRACQSHSTLRLPTCCERLLALSNPCWTLPVGCSLVHRGQIESTINLYPAKGKAMVMSAATTSLEWPD